MLRCQISRNVRIAAAENLTIICETWNLPKKFCPDPKSDTQREGASAPGDARVQVKTDLRTLLFPCSRDENQGSVPESRFFWTEKKKKANKHSESLLMCSAVRILVIYLQAARQIGAENSVRVVQFSGGFHCVKLGVHFYCRAAPLRMAPCLGAESPAHFLKKNVTLRTAPCRSVPRGAHCCAGGEADDAAGGRRQRMDGWMDAGTDARSARHVARCF